MQEKDVLNALFARRKQYGIADIVHLRGRAYKITIDGQVHHALVLVHSFDYYRMRYHLAEEQPNLIICYIHDTCLPIPAIHLRSGNYAKEYEWPEKIKDISAQRNTKLGSQVLLGMYLSGEERAYDLLDELPSATRYRYWAKADALNKRSRGRPVGIEKSPASGEAKTGD